MKNEIIRIVRNLVGYDYLYFDSSLILKLSPHTWPVMIDGICVSPVEHIYLLHGGEWHQLEEQDRNYAKVLDSLYQRMKSIETLYAKAI